MRGENEGVAGLVAREGGYPCGANSMRMDHIVIQTQSAQRLGRARIREEMGSSFDGHGMKRWRIGKVEMEAGRRANTKINSELRQLPTEHLYVAFHPAFRGADHHKRS